MKADVTRKGQLASCVGASEKASENMFGSNVNQSADTEASLEAADRGSCNDFC